MESIEHISRTQLNDNIAYSCILYATRIQQELNVDEIKPTHNHVKCLYFQCFHISIYFSRWSLSAFQNAFSIVQYFFTGTTVKESTSIYEKQPHSPSPTDKPKFRTSVKRKHILGEITCRIIFKRNYLAKLISV